jgi:peptidoglycan/xylan/chitin deacetylase (PgdA/CDA1 family)
MIPAVPPKNLRGAILLWASLTASLLGATGVCADVNTSVKEIIENQRRILILREAANQGDRAEARRAGQYLFFRNHEIGRELVVEIAHSPLEVAARYQAMIRALDDPAYGDEDRLVLRSVLEALLRKLPPAERRDANQRLERLAGLRKVLGGSFDSAFQRMPLKPGGAHTDRWEAYVARLKREMSARQVLEALDHELTVAPEPAPTMDAAAAIARVLEWNGEELPDKVVLMTFDDGPHSTHTPAILDILKEQGVHAVFFQVGRNLGEISHGVPTPGHNQPTVSRILLEGHAVGNHSFTHPVLPKLDSRSVAREIEDTQALIEAMVPEGPGRTRGFRPPYGARDDKVLAQIEQHNLRSIIWNIDSEDWADPLPESIAHRVVQESEKAGRGIVLMHDIHARTVEALPIVIRELKLRGFRFAQWKGQKLVTEGLLPTPTPREAPSESLPN